MSKRVSAKERDSDYRVAFLTRLNQRLAVPSSEWPTVRCWTASAINKLFREIREELAAENVDSNVSHSSLLKWLCDLHLAFPLPIEDESITLFEIGAGRESEVQPFELLMAAKPAGVICYFSAVVFHELTTQNVEHHHIATIHTADHEQESAPLEKEVVERIETPKESVIRKPRGFGTILFHYQGVPFYSTRRSTRLVPGIQTRNAGPRTQFRLTTLEQTLLDTLYKPFYCGGPEVVFEVWQEAVASQRIDEERLAEYLRTMNYPATTRRLGVMLELNSYSVGAELKRLFEDCQGTIERDSPYAKISLLPGVQYQTLNEPWLVFTP